MENNELEPKVFFDYLKSKKQGITDEDLTKFYDGCLQLVHKHEITGQKKIINKLAFLVNCVDREREIVKLGINTFVYKDDIEEYIDNVSKNTVKIIELENYPREIPDEIVSVIEKTKTIFDKMYVVFTDYTGRVEKQVAKERRDKDPILFGTFQKELKGVQGRNVQYIVNDRFYFLGDWEDEYCDLTMDKFLNEAGKEKLKTIGTPTNPDSIKAELNRLDAGLNITTPEPKQTWFKNITSVFKK